MTKHQETCEAPLCVDDCSPELVWYAGELLCKKASNTVWGKKQKVINNYIAKGGHLKIENQPLGVPLLESRSF